MSDQCQHCEIRGDYEKCIETPCFHHENWINLQRIEKIETLKAELIKLKVDRVLLLLKQKMEGNHV